MELEEKSDRRGRVARMLREAGDVCRPSSPIEAEGVVRDLIKSELPDVAAGFRNDPVAFDWFIRIVTEEWLNGGRRDGE